MAIPPPLEHNAAGKNPASPDHPLAVRFSDGEKFTPNGEVSEENSTIQEIEVGTVWTGEWIDCRDYATVSSLVRTDVEPVGDNFDIQFSADGIEVDYSSPIHIHSGGEGTARPHLHTVLGPFFRVVYDTSAATAANIRITTLMNRTRDRERTITANEPLTESEDATAFRPVSDFSIDATRGALGYASVINKFGHNEDLGTVIEDIWSVGGIYAWLTAGVALEAISTDADDTAAGAGVRSIMIEGLDDNFNEISQEIPMAGLSASDPTTLLFRRVNRAYSFTAGTFHAGAQGDIIVRVAGAGAIQCEILHTDTSGASWNYGQTQLARYTVPAGKTALVRHIVAASVGGKPADIVICRYEGADIIAAPFTAPRVLKQFPELAGVSVQHYHSPLLVPEKTDIWANGRLLAGSAGKVTIDMEILLHEGVL